MGSSCETDMIEVKGLNAFLKKTEAQRARVKQKATDFVRGKAKLVLLEAYRVSPQWSGDFAYNWSIETSTSGSRGYTPFYKKDKTGRKDTDLFEPVQMGDPAAGTSAMRQWEHYSLGSIKWNSKIKLVNYAPEAEGIATGELVTRPENIIPGATCVLAYLQQKFPFLET